MKSKSSVASGLPGGPGEARPVDGTALALERNGLLSASLNRCLGVPRRALAGCATLFVVAYFHGVVARPFLYAPIGFDEQFFLYEGYSLGRGLVPYRDFQEFKPPVIFLANMLALKLFGLPGMGFRRLFTLLALAGFLAVAAALLSRRVHPLIVIGLEAMMAHHFFDPKFLWAGWLDIGAINNSEALGVDFFLMSLGVLLAKTRWRTLQQVVGGALLALAPLSKEPFALPAIAAWLCLMTLYQNESIEPRAWMRFAARTILGAISVAGVWFVYMVATRSVRWYALALRESFIYARYHNTMYGIFPPNLGILDTLEESWRRLRELYVNPSRMVPFVPLFVAAVTLWRRRLLRIATLVVATYLAGLFAVAIGHGFFSHYFVLAMAGTFFAATLGAVALNDRLEQVATRNRFWICAWVGAAGLGSLWPQYEQVEKDWKTFRPADPPVDMNVVRMIQEHTTPNDRIWNIGVPAIYVFSGRLSASRIPYMHDTLLHIYPGKTDAERLAPYRAELETTMPKLVILGPQGSDGRGQHMDLLVNPFLTAHGYKRISPDGMDAIYELPR
jgi:hypothetical protein